MTHWLIGRIDQHINYSKLIGLNADFDNCDVRLHYSLPIAINSEGSVFLLTSDGKPFLPFIHDHSYSKLFAKIPLVRALKYNKNNNRLAKDFLFQIDIFKNTNE